MEAALSPPSTDGEVPRVPNAQPRRPEDSINGTNGVHKHATSSTDIQTAVEDAFKLSSQYGYKPRRLKVFTIGAGFSGLLIAHKLQHRFPEMQEMVDHTIFEALPEVGGTWYMNNYPGVQCDVPAHIYAFPFDPNPNWKRFYASGADILEYIKSTVKKWNLDRDLQLNTKVIGADWRQDIGQWKVTVEHEGKQREEYCHVLISSQGVLVHENWPQIPGLREFKGHLTHSARWDHSYDYSNKRIAVIGNGSSGIQIVPQMTKLPGTDVTNFIRGPAWVYYRAPPSRHLGREFDDPNPEYTEEEKQRFQDPEKHLEHRKGIISRTNKSFYIFLKGKNNKEGMETAAAQMAEKLGHDPQLCEMLIPKWELGCRRITPGPGYLESFLKPNCHLTNSGIVKVSDNAIHTADGKVHEVDVIICATGFDVSHRPRYPIVGLDKTTSLATEWKTDPQSYLSVAVPNYPNYFLMMGPNCLGGHGSLVESLNWTGDYFVKWIKKMATEDIKYVHPKQSVVEAFIKTIGEIHKSLVWTGSCSSWYKRGTVDGRVTALFGGSAHMFQRMLSDIRGEDFNIEYNTVNPFRFMGNGFTEWEFDEKSDLSWYVEKAETLRSS
ncbi:flavin-binding monooxygenase-like domain-containing protein [Sarocladium implicatum]|nr:flavin-binding monooxygenase-like domain-containing protein [Sarocladium implicatum]